MIKVGDVFEKGHTRFLVLALVNKTKTCVVEKFDRTGSAGQAEYSYTDICKMDFVFNIMDTHK
jgi:hypothetical protein